MKIKQHAHAVQINARPERCSADKGGRTSVMKTMAAASEAIETRVRITTTRVRGDRIMAAGENWGNIEEADPWKPMEGTVKWESAVMVL